MHISISGITFEWITFIVSYVHIKLISHKIVFLECCIADLKWMRAIESQGNWKSIDVNDDKNGYILFTHDVHDA